MVLSKPQYKKEIWTIKWVNKTNKFWFRPNGSGHGNTGKIYLSDGREGNYEIMGDQLRFDGKTFIIIHMGVYPARMELRDENGNVEIFELSQQ